MLTDDGNGTFGVDTDGNLYKATNRTNFEAKDKHRITVMVSDNGIPTLKVSLGSRIPAISFDFNVFCI